MGNCSLPELRSSGSFFTWNNKHGDNSRVYSRIDRVLVNGDWVTKLPGSEVHFDNEELMNHCLEVINWDNGHQKNRHRFRNYNMWNQATDFQQQVEQNWNRGITGTQMYRLVGKLNRLKKTLKEINKAQFGDIEGKAKQAKKELEDCQSELQSDPTNIRLITKEVQLAKNYQKWNLARNQYLKQKCKVHWLNLGDMNTKFFHSTLKSRKNANRIFTIKDNTWFTINDMNEIAKTFVEYYTSLLGTKSRDRMRLCGATVKQGPVRVYNS